ncbi:MAG: hypothetical protein AAF828_00550 [Bacteroidota bacterium]
MKERIIGLLCLLLVTAVPAHAQYLDLLENEGGYLFGLRGGPSLGSQSWSGFEMRPLLTYHGDLFIESIPVEGKFSLWASLGYHIRGSRINSRNVFDINGDQFRVPGETFEFQNLSLAIGAKQVFKYTAIADIFYTFGVRVDYNLDTNLDQYNDLNDASAQIRLFYPFETYDWIRRVTYGITAGAGFDIPLSEKVGATIQITASPDFSLQYDQPPIENVIDPFRAGNTSLPQRQIRNFTLEISAGFRFLRKVIYVD